MKSLIGGTAFVFGLVCASALVNAESLFHQVSGKWEIFADVTRTGESNCVATGRYNEDDGRLLLVASVDELAIRLVVLDSRSTASKDANMSLRFFRKNGVGRSYTLQAAAYRNRIVSAPIDRLLVTSWAGNDSVEVTAGTLKQKVSLTGTKQAANLMMNCLDTMKK